MIWLLIPGAILLYLLLGYILGILYASADDMRPSPYRTPYTGYREDARVFSIVVIMLIWLPTLLAGLPIIWFRDGTKWLCDRIYDWRHRND